MTPEAPVPTKVGNGISARAAGVIIVGALAVVVGVAFSNRPAAPGMTPLAVVPPTAATTPTPALPAATSSPTPNRLKGDFSGNSHWADDAFALVGIIGGRQYLILLDDDGNGTFDGWARLPYPNADTKATIQLAQLWTRAPAKNFQSIGSWQLPLDILMPEVRQSGTVLTVAVAGSPSGTNRLAANGFQLAMRLESRADFAVMFVTIGMRTSPVEHRKVYGEDGIFGLPGSPWLTR